MCKKRLAQHCTLCSLLGMNFTKNQVISAKLLALIQSGKTVKEAFAIVLPNVNFEAMVGEIYDALRAK